MRNLDEQISSLEPHPGVERLIREMVRSRPVTTDRRSNYLSVRPAPIGAIAVYAHSDHVSIACDPTAAKKIFDAVPAADLRPKTPATTYILFSSTAIDASFADIAEAALAAVDWRATGPQMTLGAGGNSRRNEPVRDTCPNCWETITPSGACQCTDFGS